MGDDDMRIGEVARRAGVRVSLLRYYEDVGLVRPVERVSGQRRYDASVLRRLTIIDIAQRAGLRLEEIRELIEAGDEPASVRLQAVAQRRLVEVEALIDRSRRVHTWLTAAAGCRCEAIDDCALFDDAGELPSADRPLSPSRTGGRL